MKTSATADDSYDFCIIGHPGSEKYDRDENQYRHKGENQIENPKRVKIYQKIPHREAIALYSRCFGLYIYNDNNNRQECQHKNEGSQIFFDDVEVYDFHKMGSCA